MSTSESSPGNWLFRSIYASAIRQGVLSAEWQQFVRSMQVSHCVEQGTPIPSSVYEATWAYLADLSGMDSLPLTLGEQHPADLGIVGMILKCSRDADEGLRALCHYWPIVSSESEWLLTKAGPDTKLSIRALTEAYAVHRNVEYLTASILSILRKYSVKMLSPKVAEFQYREPHNLAEYYRVFRSSLKFGSGEISLRFDTADLQQPLVTTDATLSQSLCLIGDGMLSVAGSGKDVVALVRGVLTRDIGKRNLGIADVGRKLAMSTRTLQRRLAEAGTTFDQVLTDYRKEMAVGLLRTMGSRVDDISIRLGYANPSNFIRAFKVWFATTPAEFRSRDGAAGFGEELHVAGANAHLRGGAPPNRGPAAPA